MTRKSKLQRPTGEMASEWPSEWLSAMESIHLSEEDELAFTQALEDPTTISLPLTGAMCWSQRLSETRWLAWVDSRWRITIPKSLRDQEDWRGRDVIGFELFGAAPGFIMRNVSRDLRRALAELETLRGARPRSAKAKRAAELGRIVATIADYLYPVDQTDASSVTAQQAFARSMTEQRLRRDGAQDPVDAILAALDVRRAMHEAFP